jgi:RNA polymerase sigma-70 factor (ECF subfamily)
MRRRRAVPAEEWRIRVREDDWLAERFEAYRSEMRTVAYRLLGSATEADDAVQEAWIRFHRADASKVENLGGWLATVVGRVCLDMLRSRSARREDPLDVHRSDPVVGPADSPEQEALLADSIGLALLVVLDTLTPAERLAFVLHDMFAVPYEEIAPILDRTPGATKMLASRARRRVQAADSTPDSDPTRQHAVVSAFLAAARRGDFEALVRMLDPDAVLTPDRMAVQVGGAEPVRGAAAVAGQLYRRAQAVQLALINGRAGAAWASGGRPRVVFDFTVTFGKISAVAIIGDPAHIDRLKVEFR